MTGHVRYSWQRQSGTSSQLLDEVRSAVLANSDRVLSLSDIRQGERSALEYVVEVKGVPIHGRFFAADGSAFQLIATGPDVNGATSDATRFLNSVQVQET
jgi:hypothetical protein